MSVYMPLDCDGFATALATYLEGDAPDAVRAAVEAHADGCAECGALLADLQAIRHDAAALPALAPSRDLWSGIAQRIDARVIPLSRPAPTIVPARRSWTRPAIAAAALVVATAGITHYATRARYDTTTVAATTATTPASVGRESTTTPTMDAAEVAASGPTASDIGAGSTTERPGAQRGAGGTPAAVASTGRPGTAGARLASAEPVMRATEPLYDREIAKLRTIVKSRRAQLDPATVAVLEQSIAVIDSAIAQSRAALIKDPASGFLATQLNHSLEKKVELLRTAAMLPART
jgi:anti-sigma factor RsiW